MNSKGVSETELVKRIRAVGESHGPGPGSGKPSEGGEEEQEGGGGVKRKRNKKKKSSKHSEKA